MFQFSVVPRVCSPPVPMITPTLDLGLKEHRSQWSLTLEEADGGLYRNVLDSVVELI